MTSDTLISPAGIQRPRWGRVPYDLSSRRPWMQVPFPVEEYKRRWSRVGERLGELGLDALVVYATPGDTSGVRYLTNFDSCVGHTAAIVTRRGECILTTNSLMRAEPMQSGIWATYVEDVRIAGNRRYAPDAKLLETLIVEALQDHLSNNSTLGVCGPFPEPALAHIAASTSPRFEIRDASVLLADLMSVKSPAEIALMRQANAVADTAMQAVRDKLRPGVSESELAGAAYEAMMAGGAEGPSFPLAMAGGLRAGLKHASPTDYRLRDGDFLFMDLGITYQGYVTDTARSTVVGRLTPEQRRFLDAADAMTRASIAAAGPGVPQSEVDDAAFRVACEFGFADDYYFRAHGVGTSLFLPPRFSPGENTPLRAGEVLSLEPMLVRHGFGTACIEQTALITESGAELLSLNPPRWWD